VRICLVINGLDFGGTEHALEQLAVSLAARRHDVGVLVVKQPGRTAERLRARGIDVTTLGMSDRVDAPSLVGAAWRMRERLRRRPVDLVHSFLPRANIVSRVANRLSGARVPHVSSERSTDLRRSPMVRRLNQHTARWTDLVLAVSPMVRDVLVTRDRIPREKIAVLENGVDLAAVDAVPVVSLRAEVPALRPDRLTFVSAGRFVPEKGFIHLVRAFARMQRRGAAQLVLIGEGPEESLVRREVQALGLDADVHVLGFRAGVFGLLKDADAYVLSSVEEGFPMALLEAMACSLPAVATEVSGVRELVGPEGPECAAIVVPPAADWRTLAVRAGTAPGDPVRTAEALGRMVAAMDLLVEDGARRLALGRAARARIEARFTLEQMVERLERHYERLVRGGADG
jgi:glycosyltransferase involved in cell wall biosynthesis